MKLINELLRDNYSFSQAEMLQIKYHKLAERITKKKYLKHINSIKTVVENQWLDFIPSNRVGMGACV